MIVEIFFNGIFNLIENTLNFLPALPDIPRAIDATVTNVINLIFNSSSLLGVFVPLDILKTVIQLVIVIDAIEITYFVFMWVLKKIPLINIH